MSFNSTEPLGLNRGSVRAILAIFLVAAFVASLFVKDIAGDARVALGAMASSALTHYFNSRGDADDKA